MTPDTPRFTSSAAADLASDLNVDPAAITGTGKDGAITVADVRAAGNSTPADPSRPGPPPSLGDAGSDLWNAIIGDLAEGWELDRRELHALERACVCADRVANLDAIVEDEGATARGSRGQTIIHPALSEARQLELVQHRLLASLDLADPIGESASSPSRLRAQRAAGARWGRQRIGQQRRQAAAEGV